MELKNRDMLLLLLLYCLFLEMKKPMSHIEIVAFVRNIRHISIRVCNGRLMIQQLAVA